MENIKKLKTISIAILIYILATLLSLGFWAVNIRVENILMLYLVSVIIMMIEVRRYIWGFTYTAICILTFNFLFTSPRFTLRVDDPNYILTMVIFLAVSIITGVLVTNLTDQAKRSRENENRMKALLEINSGYLTLSGISNIVYYGIKSLYQAAGERCVVYIAVSPNELGEPYYIKTQVGSELLDNDTPANWCFINNTPCGANTGFFSDSKWVYLPIKSRNICVGVISIYTGGEVIDERNMSFINTILSELAMAIEKESIYQKQYKNSTEEGRDNLLLSLTEDFYCEYQRPVPYQDMIREACAAYEKAGNRPYLAQHLPTSPILVNADREIVVRALHNILVNALPASAGQEEIRMLLTAEHGYGRLTITGGACISPKILRDSFVKEDLNSMEPASRNLWICRSIVEANGGKISIASNGLAGASISVLLKLV